MGYPCNERASGLQEDPAFHQESPEEVVLKPPCFLGQQFLLPAPLNGMPAARPSMLSYNIELPFRNLAQSPKTSCTSIRKATWG